MKTISNFIACLFMVCAAYGGVDHGNPSSHYQNSIFSYELTYNSSKFKIDDSDKAYVKFENLNQENVLTIKALRTSIQSVDQISKEVDVTGCTVGTFNDLKGFQCANRYVLLHPEKAIFDLNFVPDSEVKAIVSSFAVSRILARYISNNSEGVHSLYLTDASPGGKFVVLGCGYEILSKLSIIPKCEGGSVKIFNMDVNREIQVPLGKSRMTYTLSYDYLFFTSFPLSESGQIEFPFNPGRIEKVDLRSGQITKFIDLNHGEICSALKWTPHGLLCLLNRYGHGQNTISDARLVMWDNGGRKIFESPSIHDSNLEEKTIAMIAGLRTSPRSDHLLVLREDIGGRLWTTHRSFIFNLRTKQFTFMTRADQDSDYFYRGSILGEDLNEKIYYLQIQGAKFQGSAQTFWYQVKIPTGEVKPFNYNSDKFGGFIGFDKAAGTLLWLTIEDMTEDKRLYVVSSWNPLTNDTKEIKRAISYDSDISYYWNEPTQELVEIGCDISSGGGCNFKLQNLRTGEVFAQPFYDQELSVQHRSHYGIWRGAIHGSDYFSISQRKYAQVPNFGYENAALIPNQVVANTVIGDGILLVWRKAVGHLNTVFHELEYRKLF